MGATSHYGSSNLLNLKFTDIMTVAELIRELQKIKNPENIKIIKWNIDYGWGEITQVKVETDCDGERMATIM